MHLGKEQAIGIVEEDMAAAVGADLAADGATADGSGAAAAAGPEREHATAG